MKEGPDIARVAALIGDPARANMLTALMSGKALTVSELAEEAGITLPTASAHLTRLAEGGLLVPRKQGRHKYFALGSDDVAHVLEALMGLAVGTGQIRTRTGPKDAALRRARVCYNHLAGSLGTQLFDAMQCKGHLVTLGDRLDLSPSGARFARGFGIDLAPLTKARSPLCRPCLDWSERRSHLAGSLGRALLARITELGWAARIPGTRVVRFAPRGAADFAAVFPPRRVQTN